jgi:tetratricopeptide (TPR) repeat protein
MRFILLLQLLSVAQDLQLKHRDRDALDLYLRILQTAPHDFNALCGASYLYGEVGKRLKDAKKQREYYENALRLAKEAYEMGPGDAEANLVMAWASGGIALISGNRQKVEAAKTVKKHIDVVLEKNPRDDRAWYILANLDYQVASANVFERAAARLVYGGFPEDMTYGKAVEAYGRAVDLKPDYILYRYEIARTLIKVGKPKEALPHLKHAETIAPLTEDDPVLVEECKKLLRKLTG